MVKVAENGVTLVATEPIEFYREHGGRWHDGKFVVLGRHDLCVALSGDLPPERIVTTFVTDMHEVFYNKHKFNGNVSSWDTSNVTNMQGMFWGAHSFNRDISAWNTSKVKNMSLMFASARKFNQDLSKWDMSSVEDVSSMFSTAHAFN